jgi:hypothetical protein
VFAELIINRRNLWELVSLVGTPVDFLHTFAVSDPNPKTVSKTLPLPVSSNRRLGPTLHVVQEFFCALVLNFMQLAILRPLRCAVMLVRRLPTIPQFQRSHGSELNYRAIPDQRCTAP